MKVAAFLWRKLDGPGHDSCRLLPTARGWRLEGVAVFLEGRRNCALRYRIEADTRFATRTAVVSGYAGDSAIDLRIARAGRGRWRCNGGDLRGMDDCVDVDLGFTPATNLLAIRRLALEVGERAEAPAVYLAFPRMRFTRLPQDYTRVSRFEYDYAAPSVGYRGRLRVSPIGAVRNYPGLFEQVPAV